MKRFFTSVCFILIIATVLSSCAFWDTTDVNSDTDVDSGTDGVINYPTYDSESTIETEVFFYNLNLPTLVARCKD